MYRLIRESAYNMDSRVKPTFPKSYTWITPYETLEEAEEAQKMWDECDNVLSTKIEKINKEK